jgi:radical SAM-linked protein
MRIRITFAKTEAMRYTSHLDLQRTWERTLRRARLPVTHSQGFNKRPRLNLAAALPLGFTSQCELAEVWLDQDQSLGQIETRLRETVPPGIEIKSIEEVDPQTPKIPNLVDSATYLATLLEPVSNLEDRITAVLLQKNIMRERRGKAYNLRPLIEDLNLPEAEQGDQKIWMHLAARGGATGRPEEVLLVLGIHSACAWNA